MGLGILDDHKLQHVPGTATLEDLDELAAGARAQSGRARLKTDKNGVILVPQPSDDPLDPLNFPLWRRDLITTILCLWSVIASTLSPLLAANTLTLTLYFRRAFGDIALLTGYHLLGVGVAGFIFVASARVWGKRHLYLLGTVIIIISSIWGGASNENFKSLMAARFFQGVGLAPFEALVNASVGDLYFVHERGSRMALSNLSLFGGAFFTPVIVGKLTHSIGWQWSFYLIAIFGTALLPLVVLLVPETAFRRDESFNTDTLMTTNQAAHANGPIGRDQELSSHGHYEPEKGIEMDQYRQTSHEHTHSGDSQTHSHFEPKNQSASGSSEQLAGETTAELTPVAPPRQKLITRETLMPFNGRKTDEHFGKLLLRPFPLFIHPGIFMMMLMQGMMIGWTVLIGIVLAAIMLGPPLFFNEVQTGYMYTGAFVGALLGFALAGLISDPAVKWMTKRNRGIYEPEFRLVLVIPQLIFGCGGLYGFGITANNTPRYGWFWPDFFFGMEVMGMVLGAVASALYIVDAHRDIAVEAFTCLLVFKNILSFGLTYSGYGWLVKYDIKPVFMAVSSVQVVICCLTVPLYILGKKNRSFFARHDLLKIFKVK